MKTTLPISTNGHAPEPDTAALRTQNPEPRTQDFAASLFTIETTALNSPEARRAHYTGLLAAKGEALTTARRLVLFGRPLILAVLLVSFVHIWYLVSQVAPASITALHLPDYIYHISSALLIITIDATAFFLLASRSATRYAGLFRDKHTEYSGGIMQYSIWFYYILTALLNAIYILTFTPDIAAQVAGYIPGLKLISSILLALLVPVSLVSIETAHQYNDVARLALLVETSTLRGVIRKMSGDDQSSIAGAIVQLLTSEPGSKLTFAEIADALDTFQRGAVSNALSQLVSGGQLQREGAKRSYRYFV